MKRILSVIMMLAVLVSMMSVAMAVPERLPGQGKDGSVNGQGHDWATETKTNQNDDKEWIKENPGYRNHLPAGMVD